MSRVKVRTRWVNQHAYDILRKRRWRRVLIRNVRPVRIPDHVMKALESEQIGDVFRRAFGRAIDERRTIERTKCSR